jgi:hypothetical protein
MKAASAKPPVWTVHLKQLGVTGGSMGFSDTSIQPNFSARIDALKGTIGNITNAPGQTAAIDLSGQVMDQFSPVTIKGAMDLAAYDRKTDMQLAFHSIELPVFNPYSGRYAGFAIAKGKLAALNADHRHDRLEDLYRRRLSKKPAYPDVTADQLKTVPGAKSDASDDGRKTLLETQWLRRELRKSFMPSNAELTALGTTRAAAVRNALLADGSSVDPARVFMSAGMTETASEGHSRMELKFE